MALKVSIDEEGTSYVTGWISTPTEFEIWRDNIDQRHRDEMNPLNTWNADEWWKVSFALMLLGSANEPDWARDAGIAFRNVDIREFHVSWMTQSEEGDATTA